MRAWPPSLPPLAAPIAARLGVVKAIFLMLVIGSGAFLGFHFFQPLWAWFALRIVLHFALTVLFVLSEYWINASAPPEKRGLVLGIYSTSLSLGFALGPWLFSKIGSTGGLPFYVGFAIIMIALIPVAIAWRDSPDFEEGEHVPFLPFILPYRQRPWPSSCSALLKPVASPSFQSSARV